LNENAGVFTGAVEWKFSSDISSSGKFSGWASVFDVEDSHKDVVSPGAFRDTLASYQREGRGFPPLRCMHGMGNQGALPIGVITDLREEPRGLRMDAKIVGATTTETGRYNLALLTSGALKGLSIGYTIPQGGAVLRKDGGRFLNKINLREISLVDQPSNPKTYVDEFKARWANQPVATFRDDKHRTIGGLATLYGKVFVHDTGGYAMFAPGCFSKSLMSGRTIRVLYSHDESRLLGASNGAGLELKTNEDGLVFSLRLPRSVDGDLVHSLLTDRGTLGMSIGCKILHFDEVEAAGETVKIIRDADLSELSVCLEGRVRQAFCVLSDSTDTKALLTEQAAQKFLGALKDMGPALGKALARA
jgi:HK97 family phage prohead protease